MALRILGLDIGGANLKAAHTSGVACLRPFELWKQPAHLPQALAELIQQMPASDLLAVTMTGELCDCFETRREGVLSILDAVEAVAKERKIAVWLNSCRFADLPEARKAPLHVAAANWLALAAYAGRFAADGSALLIDVGSTTTDIVALADGKPDGHSLTDFQRLRSGELAYTGVRRTPLCALLGASAAAEFFATTLDAYLVLGEIPEDPADHATADGRPATIRCAHARLARMLCLDAETCAESRSLRLARRARSRQIRLLRRAIGKVTAKLPAFPRTIILAGSGEFLARHVVNSIAECKVECISLSRKLGPETSQAACAYAVAMLAEEYCNDGG